MLTRILLAALVAGVLAGGATSLIQHFTTTPLIIEAERYEGSGASATHEHSSVTSGAYVILADGAAGAEEAEAWAPGDGLERSLYTSLATIGTSFGFALILMSAMVLSGARITARTGLAWGLAAFAATGLAPALGLSPELPGSAAAELGARQAWWIGTAAATAAGLWLALRISTVPAIAAGVALMAIPHIIGAPHPEAFTSTVPSELSGHFASSSLVVHAIGWALVGAILGYMWQRGADAQTVPA